MVAEQGAIAGKASRGALLARFRELVCFNNMGINLGSDYANLNSDYL